MSVCPGDGFPPLLLVTRYRIKQSQFKTPLGRLSNIVHSICKVSPPDGLKPGYTDGFSGRIYRAASLLRFASDGLSAEAAITDPKNLYFDQGVSAGYGDGLDRGQKDGSAKDNVELAMVGCSNFQPVRTQDLPAQGSFCEGYRRGYLLGHSDGFALRPEHVALQASK